MRKTLPVQVPNYLSKLGFLVIGFLVIAGCMFSDSRPFQLLSVGELVYPEEAKRAKITGSVTLRYDILNDGSVANVAVVNSVPPGVFDTVAVNYVRTWVFLPARKNGVVQVTKNVESDVTFKLSELMDDPPDY